MEENLNTIFVTYIKKHRVRTVYNLLNEVLPTFYEHGFVFDDFLDALANYMNDSENLTLNECVPFIERAIDHLRALNKHSSEGAENA